MSRGLLLLLQVAVAVVAILLWHLFTTTSLVGDPSRMQFFFRCERIANILHRFLQMATKRSASVKFKGVVNRLLCFYC